MKTAITVVLEYDDDGQVPRIGPDTRTFFHSRVRAIQFSDALAELEVLHTDATDDTKARAFAASGFVKRQSPGAEQSQGENRG